MFRWSVNGSAYRAAYFGYLFVWTLILAALVAVSMTKDDPRFFWFLVFLPAFGWMPWAFARAVDGGD